MCVYRDLKGKSSGARGNCGRNALPQGVPEPPELFLKIGKFGGDTIYYMLFLVDSIYFS